MLFHSVEFLLVFLPATFAATAIVRAVCGVRASLALLSAASVLFYAQWSLIHGAILTASILCNFGLCQAMLRTEASPKRRQAIFFGGVAANLGFLGYLKYANFFIDNINLSGAEISHIEVIAPIGVSFFTFIQIGFLVEVFNRQVKHIRLTEYFLFGSFFGYLTAGPLVLQRDMLPQFEQKGVRFLDPNRLALALTIIGFGLFKKLALADSIAPFADAVFDGVADGGAPSLSLAWIGALSYTAQLYFDFSGYSDMALGIGLLFGLKLPFNFNSPLKATSIVDFWHRWHMTMTRFFTNYVYAPLAVGQMRASILRGDGAVKRFLVSAAAPVFITFLLAGIWHGSGWTFVLFGVLHGAAMAINHAWKQARLPAPPTALGWLITMLVVVVGLVIFRAPDVATATTMLTAMVAGDFGGHTWTAAIGTPEAVNHARAIALISLLFGIALLMPNTQQVLRGQEISCDPLDDATEAATPFWMQWRPSPRWACVLALIFAVSIGLATGETAFIYYKF